MWHTHQLLLDSSADYNTLWMDAYNNLLACVLVLIVWERGTIKCEHNGEGLEHTFGQNYNLK